MKKKAQLICSVLLAILFVNSGLNKFFNYFPMPEDMPQEVVDDFVALQEIVWLMPLISIVEIIAGLMLIPRKTRLLAAVILTPIMVGITLTHLTVAPDGLPIVVLMLAVMTWIMFDRKEQLMGLLK
ncbi:DoxX family protein [Penaeicola halotolerans]|uniref:DoxX family protein n=1 Tax=Penaeicola halotolerans TaxID=2793196 RepID=UPI001CF7ECF4|nr:DoxX family protein [Penaeicola halotolerans]